MRSGIEGAFLALLGRRTTWRLARSLYLKARNDPPNDPRINGEELLQRQLLAALATSGERIVVFDVGANVGDWSWSLLEEASRLGLGDRLEVHAFEPSPPTFSLLEERIRGHPLGRTVHLVNQALSCRIGQTDLFVGEPAAGTHSLHPDAMDPAQRRIRIGETTADAYCSSNGVQRLHYLKCDTEGADADVLRGAGRLFEERRILACQFEYNHRWVYSRHYLKDIFEMFEGTPYQVGKIVPRGIELYERWHFELERFIEGNYVVLDPGARGWFTTRRGDFDRSNTWRALD